MFVYEILFVSENQQLHHYLMVHILIQSHLLQKMITHVLPNIAWPVLLLLHTSTSDDNIFLSIHRLKEWMRITEISYFPFCPEYHLIHIEHVMLRNEYLP